MERSKPGLLKILHDKNIINKKSEDVDDEIINGSKESEQEPNSPTISCVGKVKSEKKCEKNLHLFFRRKICPFSSSSSTTATPCRRKKPSVIKPVFYLTENDKIPKNMRTNNNVERKSGCKLRAMWKPNNSREGTVSKLDWNTAVSNSGHGNTSYEEEPRPSGNKFGASGDGCKLREKADCLLSKMNRSVACRRGGRLANFDWKATEEAGPDDRVDRNSGGVSVYTINNINERTKISLTGGESYCKQASTCLRKMNRSTACRRGGALSNFDWRRVAKEEDEEGEDVIDPVLAPGAQKQQLVAVEPIRTEVNIWQRRTFAKPVPIQLT